LSGEILAPGPVEDEPMMGDTGLEDGGDRHAMVGVMISLEAKAANISALDVQEEQRGIPGSTDEAGSKRLFRLATTSGSGDRQPAPTLRCASMSSVRVKKRAPIAYVPLEPNTVVVVPADDIPNPELPNSPQNQQVLQQRAEHLALPSSSQTIASPSATTRLRSNTVQTPTSPPLVSPPKRLAISIFGSNESLGRGEQLESPRSMRPSWFMDHVMRPRAGTTQGSRSDVRSRASNDRDSLTGSVPQVDVIIPDEARSGFAQALAARERHDHEGSTISESQLHHNDIVEHLDVIDAHISTVSHLSNAANSILVYVVRVPSHISRANYLIDHLCRSTPVSPSSNFPQEKYQRMRKKVATGTNLTPMSKIF
jgi:hypothetical protein